MRVKLHDVGKFPGGSSRAEAANDSALEAFENRSHRPPSYFNVYNSERISDKDNLTMTLAECKSKVKIITNLNVSESTHR